jgi:predicted nucleotidyltransferase
VVNDIDMKEIGPVIRSFKAGIRRLYGKRLKKIILFGSWARGDAREDSDIDLAVVLAGEVRSGKEIDRMIGIVSRVNLDHGVLLAVYPVSEKDFLGLKSPLLMNIRKEGVAA